MVSAIKKMCVLTFLNTISIFSINAQNSISWKIDKANTSVNFSANHFFSAITGKFSQFDGSVNFSPDKLQESNVTFIIAVKSINTDDTKRDKHLQSKDFFNAKIYPNVIFISEKFEKKSDKEYLVYGKLTIRDKTKDIILPLKITGEMEHPKMKGTIILGLASTLTINRTDYGVGVGSWVATGIIGDEVEIKINAELNRNK